MIKSLYLQWKRLRKIVFLYRKINVKYFFHFIVDQTFQFPSIGCKSSVFMICQSYLNCLLKSFTWNSSKPKVNHKTSCNTFEDRGLKNIDVKSKIINLQCSWDKKLYDSNHHDWKIIALYFINKYFW